MRTAVFIFLTLAAASPVRAAPGFCDDLRLMIRSVHDTPTFASVTRTRQAPDLALFRHCRANVEGFTSEVGCTMELGSDAPAVESLAADVARCLPGARRLDYPQARTLREAWLSFELLVIKVGQDRNAAGAIGGRARIIVAIPEG